MADSAARDLQWLMRDFTLEIPGVQRVVLVSADGLLLASAYNGAMLPGDPADEGSTELAAIVSALVGLAAGGARLLQTGQVRQTIVSMTGGSVVAMSVSDGSCLGVQAASEADLSVIAYQMTVFVKRAGHVLTPELRAEMHRVVSWR